MFTATAFPVALFVLFYSLGYVDFHTVTSPDSAGYLQRVLYGSYSPLRNAGYPTILLAVQNTVGLDHLAWIQLGAGIACYLAGAFLLAVRFANKWIGSVLVLAILLQGTISQFAPDVMTEALFTAGLGLFAAALGVLAWRPDRRAVIAAAVGIVLATLAKSLGVVLVLPALLLVRFLPKGNRLSVSGVIVVCGLATYALMAISSYTRTGIASPESFAGYSLIGHVGWMLDDASMPPSDLTRSLISAAAPVIEQRPADLTDIHSLATLDRYVDVTVQDFNTVALAEAVSNRDISTWLERDVEFLLFALRPLQHSRAPLFLSSPRYGAFLRYVARSGPSSAVARRDHIFASLVLSSEPNSPTAARFQRASSRLIRARKLPKAKALANQICP